MDQPLVSVIIPTYNRAHCVGQAIDSVLAQTYPHFEVLVIDDGSRDETPTLLSRAYGHDPRVRAVRQDNGGVSAARNHGLRLARGELIAFLDSDDAWLPWKLELQVACLQHFPDAALSWADMQAVDPGGNLVKERYLTDMYAAYRWFSRDDLFTESIALRELCPGLAQRVGEARVYKGHIYAKMIMGNLVHTSCVLARRDALARAGMFDEGMRKGGEDFDYHIRACRQGPVLYLDLPLIRYEIGAGGQITDRGSGIYFSRNYLHTIRRELHTHRREIDLPPALIKEALASGHAWLGEELLDLGQKCEARDHLLRSVRLDARGARKYLLLLGTVMPAGMRTWLRRVRRGKTVDPAAATSPATTSAAAR